MTTVGDYGNNLLEIILGGERMSGSGNIREILERIELGLAYCSDKLLNLEMLLTHVGNIAGDRETLELGKVISIDVLEKSFEFDNLSGILVSEVKELEFFTYFLQKEIIDTRQKITAVGNLEITSGLEDIEKELDDAEESLRRSFDQILEIKAQAMKYEKVLAFGEEYSGRDELFSSGSKWPLQTIEHKKTLQMLEKSLARELGLEKMLSDSRHNEEKIKLKLNYAEHDIYFLEEAIENMLERYFEAENAAELFMGIAKELRCQLQQFQLSLNGSIHRESELRRKIKQDILRLSDQESAINKFKSADMDLEALAQQADELMLRLKEAEEKYKASDSDASILRNQVRALEQELKESSSLLRQANALAEASKKQQNVLHCERLNMENSILKLKKNIAEAESRAETAEARCSALVETNLELNKELGILKSNEDKNAYALEEKLMESDAQLENAKTSYEAFEEKQVMLYSALTDMEGVIKEMKVKLSKEEKRADNAESRCNLLAENNLELNEEVSSLRDKLEYLEKSLHQAENIRLETAKGIGIKTKVITDLVVKLALERERLQTQIIYLKKENKLLAKKCLKANNTGEGNESVSRASVKSTIESSSRHRKIQVEGTAAETPISGNKEAASSVPAKDETVVESEPPPVRNIGRGF